MYTRRLLIALALALTVAAPARAAAPGWSPTGARRSPAATHPRCCSTTAKCSSPGATARTATLASAELYDPATGQWSPTGIDDRAAHVVPAWPSCRNGKVVAAGGYNAQGPRLHRRVLRPRDEQLDGHQQHVGLAQPRGGRAAARRLDPVGRRRIAERAGRRLGIRRRRRPLDRPRRLREPPLRRRSGPAARRNGPDGRRLRRRPQPAGHRHPVLRELEHGRVDEHDPRAVRPGHAQQRQGPRRGRDGRALRRGL